MKPSFLRICAACAALASALGCIADLLLLYSPDGGYLDGNYAFLPPIESGRMMAGHYLGILVIPASLIGLPALYEVLRPSARWVRLLALGGTVYLCAVGTAYHASLFALSAHPHDPLFIGYSEPLALVFGSFFLMAGSFMVLVGRGKTIWPSWKMALSPLPWVALCYALYWIWPLVGNVSLPMAFNFSLMVFYLALWGTRWARPNQ